MPSYLGQHGIAWSTLLVAFKTPGALRKKNTSASAISPSVIPLKSLYLNPFSCLYK